MIIPKMLISKPRYPAWHEQWAWVIHKALGPALFARMSKPNNPQWPKDTKSEAPELPRPAPILGTTGSWDSGSHTKDHPSCVPWNLYQTSAPHQQCEQESLNIDKRESRCPIEKKELLRQANSVKSPPHCRIAVWKAAVWRASGFVWVIQPPIPNGHASTSCESGVRIQRERRGEDIVRGWWKFCMKNRERK